MYFHSPGRSCHFVVSFLSEQTTFKTRDVFSCVKSCQQIVDNSSQRSPRAKDLSKTDVSPLNINISSIALAFKGVKQSHFVFRKRRPVVGTNVSRLQLRCCQLQTALSVMRLCSKCDFKAVFLSAKDK